MLQAKHTSAPQSSHFPCVELNCFAVFQARPQGRQSTQEARTCGQPSAHSQQRHSGTGGLVSEANCCHRERTLARQQLVGPHRLPAPGRPHQAHLRGPRNAHKDTCITIKGRIACTLKAHGQVAAGLASRCSACFIAKHSHVHPQGHMQLQANAAQARSPAWPNASAGPCSTGARRPTTCFACLVALHHAACPSSGLIQRIAVGSLGVPRLLFLRKEGLEGNL